MNHPVKSDVHKAVDGIQQRLTEYAYRLNYDDLPSEVVHAAKVRIIDTLGALVGGFFGEPCRIARDMGAQAPNPEGATIIGTRMKTAPDIAAFVNATTARYVEMTDTYHRPGSSHGHTSDVITPILAVAEFVQANGRDFITGVVLGYEVFCRISDVFHNDGFDHTNFGCVATAAAAGKLMGLTPQRLAHCISMAVVPNVILKQTRTGPLSMFKATASGQAGRSGVFAALLARAGMEGPHLPYEGKSGWCDHVARERFSLNVMGGESAPFKVTETQIKTRPASGETIASVLAAEKIAPLQNIENVKQITVEAYKSAQERGGTGAHRWHPESKESADGSIPYVVAVTLIDGTVTLRSYDDSHFSNPKLRALMQKVEVIENPEFTQAFQQLPQQHRTRITVVTNEGARLVGEAGGAQGDLATPRTDTEIEQKFRTLAESVLGSQRIDRILDRLWHLHDMKNVGALAPAFVFV